MEQKRYLKLVERPEYKTNVLYVDAFNSDIIKALNSLVPGAASKVKKLAPEFAAASPRLTAYKIWRFLRKYGRYVRDSNESQNIREPNRFIYDTFLKQNSGDCKSFTLFTVSILRALGLPAFIKYAGYIPGLEKPSHVYAFTLDTNGQPVIIDGCYPSFNREKKFTYSQTFNTNTMKVASLSSPEINREKALKFYRQCSPVQKRQIRARLSKKRALINGTSEVIESEVIEGVIDGIAARRKKTPAEKKAAKAKRRAKVKKGLKKFGTGVKFIALGAGRGAFLALVALNVSGWASKFVKLQNTKLPNGKNAFDSTVLVKWKKMGGLEKLLRKAINTGAKKKPLFLSKKAKAKFAKAMKVSGLELDYVGDLNVLAEPISTAAIAATAVPVVAALIPVMLKAFGAIGAKKEVNQVASEGEDLVKEQAPAVEQYQEQQEQEQQEEEEAGEEAGENPAPDDNTAEEIEGIYKGEFADLFSNLGQVAAAGVQKLGQVIQKKTKKKPKLQKAILKAGQAGDDYFTGAYIRQTGAKKKAQTASKILPYAAGAAAVAAVVLLTKKSK